ncbi:guanylate kinase [Burkholderia paludis]|uniref:methyltransferase family protein n=1 Tax=Burkholderia paludis TaxID=1506587 RepID=UPI0004DB716D|nr:isoprenylcysteine carboxylmethyltransferase family protein [Burkholderia paludis]KFG95205.1 guanylate kinase [Burkholderia paludis]
MQWFLRKYPLLVFLSCCLILLIAAGDEVARHASPLHRIGIALVAMYLIWLACEARTAMTSSVESNLSSDRGTVLVYGAARVLTVASACFVSSRWVEYRPWMPVLPALFCFGIALRIVAIHTLGKFYSHKVRTLADHRIVQTGPYRWVRHPAYAGMLIAHASFVAFFLNGYSVAAFAIMLVPSIVVRIRCEERILFDVAGYADYSHGRYRLMPFVW